MLAIDFGELDADQLHAAENMGIEEEQRGVERAKQLAVFLFRHGLQLIDVADKEKLFAAVRLKAVAGVDAKHLVDEVNDVGAHHADLVDDDQLHLPDDLALLARVFQCLTDMALRETAVVGQKGMEGYLEETVERAATDVDGGDAGRGQDHMLLLRHTADMAQKGGLARAGLTCEKKAVMGVLDDLERYKKQFIEGYVS